MSHEWLGFPQAARDFSKSFPYFSKKLLKKQTKVPQKLLEKKQKTFFGLMLKYAACTTKVRFLSILCNFAA